MAFAVTGARRYLRTTPAQDCRSPAEVWQAALRCCPLYPVMLLSRPYPVRVAEAIIRVGRLAVRFLSVYGFPANHHDAASKNQELFSKVLARVVTGKLPFVIGGDVNTDVTSLPCWRGFREAGTSELHSLFQAKHRTSLPKTCKRASAWDSALLCPTMTSLWSQATVDEHTHLFDAHAPVRLVFRLPTLPPALHRWRLPVSWTEFQPPAYLVDKHYAALQARQDTRRATASSDLSNAFQQWGGDWEQAVPCPKGGARFGSCQVSYRWARTWPLQASSEGLSAFATLKGSNGSR